MTNTYYGNHITPLPPHYDYNMVTLILPSPNIVALSVTPLSQFLFEYNKNTDTCNKYPLRMKYLNIEGKSSTKCVINIVNLLQRRVTTINPCFIGSRSTPNAIPKS